MQYPGTIKQAKEPYVTMTNGTVITFLNPKRNQIKIGDVAWHLARTCRFLAATDCWYSTAEHSILGARRASCTEVARQFLVHDAAEFVFGDIASPVGRLCPEYKEMCNKFQDYLFRHFLGYKDISPEVKIIDGRMCATEMQYLRKQAPKDLEAKPYEDMHFYRYEWQDAFNAYMDSFRYFFPDYKDSDV